MSEVPFSKKGERTVTSFVGRELLYDYVRGDLEPERQVAVEKLISENRDLKTELEKIREGLRYAEDLTHMHISAPLAESIRTPSTYFQGLLMKTKFMEWPEGIKFGIEGVIVAVGALVIILFIPWGKISLWTMSSKKSPIILSEVTKSHSADPDSSGTAEAEAELNKNLLFDDESKPSEAKNANTKAPEAKKVAVMSAPVPPKAEKKNEKSDANPESNKELGAGAPDSGKKQGFLYRGTVAVTNIDAMTPKLVEFISSLGGRKAGEVELGWKKGSGTYFHFTIPEAKYKELLDHIREIGKLNIQKEPHPRVMPDGIVRLILTVEEKK